MARTDSGSSSSSAASSSGKGTGTSGRKRIRRFVVVVIVVVVGCLWLAIHNIVKQEKSRLVGAPVYGPFMDHDDDDTTTSHENNATSPSASTSSSGSLSTLKKGQQQDDELQQLQLQHQQQNNSFDADSFYAYWRHQSQQTQEAFHTTVTTPQSVLQRGFPQSWKPCTLFNLLDPQPTTLRTKQTLRMVVLGGSCSAISPPCHNNHDDDGLGGRYSNMVQRALQEAFDNFSSNSTTTTPPQRLEVEVINRAQGYTTTSWNALLLDQLVDPNTTDMLVWEFSINDFWGRGASREYQIRLQFWFTQVQRLFRHKAKPPVILLYLWEQNTKRQKSQSNATHYSRKHALGPTIWREQQAMVQKLSQHYNWNIQVITVGATLEPHLMMTYGNNNNMAKSGLTTDGLHPGCMGNTLIANMIQHVLYSDLVQCPCSATPLLSQPMMTNIGLDSTTTTITPTNGCESLPAEEPPPQSTANNSGSMTADTDATTADNLDVSSLQSLLYEASPMAPVQTGSLSRWIPNAGEGITSLRFVGKISSNDAFLHLNSKVRPGRIDRKMSYAFPLCESSVEYNDNNNNNHTTSTPKLEFTLLEPHLQWLGFAFSTDRQIMLNSPSVDNYATIRINGIPVFPRRNAAAKSDPWINHWVKVNTTFATFSDTTSKNYTVSACRKHADAGFYMHAMVAVLYQQSSLPKVPS